MGREGKEKTRKDDSATTGKAPKRKRGKGNIRINNENKRLRELVNRTRMRDQINRY